MRGFGNNENNEFLPIGLIGLIAPYSEVLSFSVAGHGMRLPIFTFASLGLDRLRLGNALNSEKSLVCKLL